MLMETVLLVMSAFALSGVDGVEPFFAPGTRPPPPPIKPLNIPKHKLNYIKKELSGKGFSLKEIDSLLNDPRLQIPNKPVEKITWEEFEKRLFAPESVKRGKIFLAQHAELLEKAQKEYRIPKEYLVALVRVESDLGDNPGTYVSLRVFYERLIWLTWKKHANYFIALAAYCKKESLDCPSIKGSDEGAFGLTQFMPTSLGFARDGNNDGKIDLFTVEDSIVSAANFLVEHGWHKNRKRALGSYYGSGAKYPDAVTRYSQTLK